MSTNHFLTPFTIASDCPQENREINYNIIINLKNNLFKETKHIQQNNIHRNHLAYYIPEISLDRDQHNKFYTFTLTDEKENRKSFYNFQNETTLSDKFRIFLKRHEDSQDRTKTTAITTTTYEILRNTADYLTRKTKQITSVNDKLRNDIKNYNNWLTKIIELKSELKTATLDIIRIMSEFTFLFWLDNIEQIYHKRIEFGETFKEEMENLNDELKNLWNPAYCSPHFGNILKITTDRSNYKEGLDSNVMIIDQGQAGSISFNLSKSLTSTSTPKDVQVNTSLQSKQKSTLKPDKPLTSNLLGYQNNAHEDEVYISDTEDKELKLGNWLPPSVNQRISKKDQIQAQNYYNRNNTYISSLKDNHEHQDMYWEHQIHNYRELKDGITEKVTDHTKN